MAKSTTLTIKILSDAKGATAGFGEAAGGLDKFERGMDKASIAAGGVLAAVGGLALQAQEAASNLQQSSGAVETVFGKSAAAIKSNAEAAAAAVRLSTNSYQELAASMGAQLGNMGIAQDQLAPKTDQLVKLGADLAATYGGTTADAVAALSSLMRGETDPAERYGIAIKASDISARLAAAGQDKLTGAAGKAAQAQAVLGMLSDQTAKAQGAAAREADTDASAKQRMAAEAENAAAALGEKLLPITTAVQQALAGMATWVANNSTTALTLAGIIGGLAVAVLAVNGAVKVYRATTVAITAAQWLFNAAAAANPIGLIVIGVAALAAGLIYAYTHFKPVRDFLGAVGGLFKDGFGWALDNILRPFLDVVGWIWDKLSKVGDLASKVGGLFSTSSGPAVGAAAAYGSARRLSSPVRTATLGGAGLAALGNAGALAGLGGGGPVNVTTINVTVQGAVDPVATGRQVESVVRKYRTVTGSATTDLGGTP